MCRDKVIRGKGRTCACGRASRGRAGRGRVSRNRRSRGRGAECQSTSPKERGKLYTAMLLLPGQG